MTENERLAKLEAKHEMLKETVEANHASTKHDISTLTKRHESATKELFQDGKDRRKDSFKILLGVIMLFIAALVDFFWARAA